jgi:serine/threonine-protein kinase
MLHAERLGKYELVRHLASGGMARVYLARLSGVGGFERHVVLKTVRPERVEDQSYLSMFLDEARLIAALHHQNIAQVHDMGVADDGTYYLAMEYLHGETVRSILEQARERTLRLPLALATTVIGAAAAGLHHAHDRRGPDGSPLGIVHRDVSPSNVICGYDGSIKLIDFGIAKAQARTTQTATGFVKGKAGYMAPEQALGHPVDRRSDVFALGIVLYELSTQSRAFRAASEFEAVQRIVRGDLVRPTRVCSDYPSELEDVVMTALETDPDDRFQDADEMRRALELTAHHLGLRNDGVVIRVLGELFGARPEPWLPIVSDEATEVTSESAPILGLPALSTVGDDLPTCRYITVDDVSERGAPAPPTRMPTGTAPPPSAAPLPAIPAVAQALPPAMATSSGVAPVQARHRPIWIALAIVVAVFAIGVVAMLAADRANVGEAATRTAPGGSGEAAAASIDAGEAAVADGEIEMEAPAPPPSTTPEISISITTHPDDATVVFDKKRIGRTPQRFKVAASSREVTIKIRKRGYETRTRKVRLDQDVVWDVRLHKE